MIAWHARKLSYTGGCAGYAVLAVYASKTFEFEDILLGTNSTLLPNIYIHS